MGALDFSKDRENSRSSLHLQLWTSAASPGRLWKPAAIRSDVSKMLLLSNQSWWLLYFHLLSLISPVPQNQAPLWNNHLLLKPRAVTGCKYHWFNLWTLVNEGTILWLQHPLGFCNNYCVLHERVCSTGFHFTAWECIHHELRARNKLFCSYSIQDEESRLGS